MIQIKESGAIVEVNSDDLHSQDPTKPITDHANQSVNSMYPWIKHNTKVTLFLSNHWLKPRQGYLQEKERMRGIFYIVAIKHKTIPPTLPQFIETAESMIHNKKIFQGWKNSASIINTRYGRCLSNSTAPTITARQMISNKLILFLIQF